MLSHLAKPRPVLLMARELGLGGSERQLCEIARALDRSRFEPHVGCFYAAGFRADELRAAGVPITCFPVRSLYSFSALAGARDLGRYIARHDIQLVHAFDAPLNLFGVPLARMFRVPVVLSSQRCDRQLLPRPVRHLLRLTDLLADGVVVNSRAICSHLMADERVPPQAVHLCYNGLDTACFQPGPRCRPPSLRDAKLVLGVVCVFRPEKDLPTLIEAFSRVRQTHPGTRLLLAGDGPLRATLQVLAGRLGLGGDCRFEPATADVPTLLRAMDIFVLPSRSEAFSNSLLEAMACGCCVMASRVGGNPELVEHGRTGLLFSPGDAGELAAGLCRLIEDGAWRQTLAAAGAAHVHHNFTREASAQCMAEIYESLLEAAAATHQSVSG